MAQLTEAREQLQRAVRAGGVGLWDWDMRTHRVFYSPEWKRQIGHEEHEISSERSEWESRIHPDDRERAIQHFDGHGKGVSPGVEHEFRFRHKDGSYRHILARGTTLFDEAGAPIRRVGTHVDITARVELDARLLQSHKMETVGRLAGGIAHDFNNLLTVINGTADLALAGLNDRDPLRADLLQIKDAGDRAASLTRQLLAFSRKQILSPDIISLTSLVNGMQNMLTRLLGENVRLVVPPSGTAAMVRADRSQIEQVIMNLAVNARDAMPHGGTLTIETSDVDVDEACADEHPSVEPGAWVMLAVSDTGVGMDEPTRAKIFEPFFTTKEAGQGTGLGLSTVYGIVNQSGGCIHVGSERGVGTTFRIYLPRSSEGVRAPQPVPPIAPAGGTEQILIVEDERALQQLAARILKSAGYTVHTASTGDEAMALLERHAGAIQLVLTDLVLPGMSGRELAARIASAYPAIRILYTSGYTDDAVVRESLDGQSDHFVAKPYTKVELTRQVRRLLDSRPA